MITRDVRIRSLYVYSQFALRDVIVVNAREQLTSSSGKQALL
jgi:hypothetical protein